MVSYVLLIGSFFRTHSFQARTSWFGLFGMSPAYSLWALLTENFRWEPPEPYAHCIALQRFASTTFFPIDSIDRQAKSTQNRWKKSRGTVEMLFLETLLADLLSSISTHHDALTHCEVTRSLIHWEQGIQVACNPGSEASRLAGELVHSWDFRYVNQVNNLAWLTIFFGSLLMFSAWV